MKGTPMPKESELSLPFVVMHARVGNKIQRALLNYLAIRANWQTRACYPSYEQLALDTGYTEKRVRNAAKEIETLNYMHRTPRNQTSNWFHINYELLSEIASGNIEKDKISRDDKLKIKANYYVTHPGSAHIRATGQPSEGPLTDPDDAYDNTDGLEAGPEQDSDDIDLARSLPDLLALTRSLWPDHPTFHEPGGLVFLEKSLQKCIDIAGSIERASELLWIISFDKEGDIRTGVAQSAKLGPYLVQCYPEWHASFQTFIVEEDPQ